MPAAADEAAVTRWLHGGGHAVPGGACDACGIQPAAPALQVRPPPTAPLVSRYPRCVKEDLLIIWPVFARYTTAHLSCQQ